MHSPTYGLLWETWRRHRDTAVAIAGLTVAGRLLDSEPSSLVDVLKMTSFLLLFGIFNYTDSTGSHGVGRFPHRLFTLPVSSLRLAAVPVVAGVASVELLHLSWTVAASRDGSTSPMFVAVLLGALMVFYQAILWTLERLGPLRLVVAGAVAIIVFAIGLLPSFAPTPPPLWRSEAIVAAMTAGVAVVSFLLSWRHIARLRYGGGASSAWQLEWLIAPLSAAMPARRTAFGSPAAAHFWFEWRSSGLALPTLVGGVLLAIVAPLSWFARHDPADTWRLLLITLGAPIILAVPVGMAFSKPTFWSEDLSLPSFVAVRPLTADDLVAVKVKVAAAAVVTSWLLVLSFLTVWLSLWANLGVVSRFVSQLWTFHGQSVAAVCGVIALAVMVGMFLTWRLLVCRLWSGLSGNRALFVASVLSAVVGVIGAIAFDETWLTGWPFDDPERVTRAVWIVAMAVAAKYLLAAYSWRRVSAPYLRQYLLVWGAGTACFLVLAILHFSRFQGLMILLSLLVVPLGRLGLAPSCLARNRHR